jgi:hypothetical protein
MMLVTEPSSSKTTVLDPRVFRAAAGEQEILRYEHDPDAPLEKPAEVVDRYITAHVDAKPAIGFEHTPNALSSVSDAFADATPYNPLRGPPRPAEIAHLFNRPGNHRQLRDADDSPYSISSGTRQFQPQHTPTTERPIDKPSIEGIIKTIRIEPSDNAVDCMLGKIPCKCAEAMRNIRKRSIAAAAMTADSIKKLCIRMEQEKIIHSSKGIKNNNKTTKRMCPCMLIGPDYFVQFSNWISGHTQPINIVAPGETDEFIESIIEGFIQRAVGTTKQRARAMAITIFAAKAGNKRYMIDKPLDARDQSGTLMLDPPLRNSVSYIPINGESNILRRIIGTPTGHLRARARAIFGQAAVLPASKLEDPQLVDATIRDHLPIDESKTDMDDEWAEQITRSMTSLGTVNDFTQPGIPNHWESPLGKITTKNPRKIIGTATHGMFVPIDKDSHPRMTKFNSWSEPEANVTARRRRLGTTIKLAENFDTSFLD